MMQLPGLSLQRERSRTDSAALIMFASIALTVGRLSLETSNWIVLWRVYGRSAVVRQHLMFVRFKPELVVSNGDVLYGYGAVRFAAAMVLWMAATVLVLVLIGKYIVPGWWNAARTSRRPLAPSGSAIVTTILMFFALAGLLPLTLAMPLGALIAIVAIARLRSLTSSPTAPPESWDNTGSLG